MNWVYRRPHFSGARRAIATVPLFFSGQVGDISASTSIAFAQTAAISSLNSIAASTSIDFAQTANLSSYGNIRAVVSIDFSEVAAADFSQIIDISAATAIDFSEIATLSDAALERMSASTTISFSTSVQIDDANDAPPVQPVLPVLIPKFRSVDGRTLADNFNRGLPETADYDWPNRRRFYQ